MKFIVYKRKADNGVSVVAPVPADVLAQEFKNYTHDQILEKFTKEHARILEKTSHKNANHQQALLDLATQCCEVNEKGERVSTLIRDRCEDFCMQLARTSLPEDALEIYECDSQEIDLNHRHRDSWTILPGTQKIVIDCIKARDYAANNLKLEIVHLNTKAQEAAVVGEEDKESWDKMMALKLKRVRLLALDLKRDTNGQLIDDSVLAQIDSILEEI